MTYVVEQRKHMATEEKKIPSIIKSVVVAAWKSASTAYIINSGRSEEEARQPMPCDQMLTLNKSVSSTIRLL